MPCQGTASRNAQAGTHLFSGRFVSRKFVIWLVYETRGVISPEEKTYTLNRKTFGCPPILNDMLTLNLGSLLQGRRGPVRIGPLLQGR